MQTRVLLLGDPNARPDGLERALVRAGFLLAEAEALPPTPGDGGSPDVTILSVGPAEEEWDRALFPLTHEAWRGVPTIALVPAGWSDAAARALALGAADVMVAPIHVPELLARMAARLRATRDGFRATASSNGQSQLFAVFQRIALATRPEEMLQLLVRGLAQSLGAPHAACVLPLDGGRARLAAVAERPEIRAQEIDLAVYPEVGHAVATGRTAYVPNAVHHPLFDAAAHRALGSTPPGSAVAVPITFQGKTVGWVVVRTATPDPALTADDVAFIETLVAATSRLLDHEERRATLYRRQASAGVVDSLTGCGGLDALERRLREEMNRSERYGRRFAVVMMDVLGLRHVNQRHGMEAGDRVLADVGALLQRELRSPDFVGRYGGDEFVLILPETDAAAARDTVTRLRAAVTASSVASLPPGAIALTVGIAAFPGEGVLSSDDLLARAERALTESKLAVA